MEFVARLVDPHEPTLEMQRLLIQRLYEGDFEAFGIMTEPDIGHELQKVPEFMFANGPRIDWSKNTISNLKRKFAGLVVQRSRRPRSAGNVTHSAPSTELAKRKPAIPAILPSERSPPRGRPSKMAEINRAIDGLVANGVNLGTMERSIAYKTIRRYAKTTLGGNTDIGYSDPVLQRCLMRRFGIKG